MTLLPVLKCFASRKNHVAVDGWISCLQSLLLAVGAMEVDPSTGPNVANRPNIVVLIADDMAHDDFGAAGNPTVRTPKIDALARSGLRWTHATLTCSSCSPSRCSILTSRYPHNTGAGELHLPLPADQTLVTTPLRQAGYYTVAAGKWHLGNQVRKQFDKTWETGDASGTGMWISALEGCPTGQPFFAWLAALDPHRDYEPGTIDPPHDPATLSVPEIFPDTPEVRQDIALYYDEVSRFDQSVGRVVAHLEASGRLQNTLIVVMSDNGRPFPHCKTRVNVDGVRTPMVMHWPLGIEPGGVTDSLMSSIDLAATFVQLAGAPHPPSFQGVSLVPVLQDPRAIVRRYAFSEHNWHDYQARERAVHTASHVLIVNSFPDLPATPPADAVRSPTYMEMRRLRDASELTGPPSDVFKVPRPSVALFDHRHDRHCLVNRIEEPALGEVRVELLTALEAFSDLTNDRSVDLSKLTPDRFDRETGRPLK